MDQKENITEPSDEKRFLKFFAYKSIEAFKTTDSCFIALDGCDW